MSEFFDENMMSLARRILEFMVSRDLSMLDNVFCQDELVSLLDSFFPYFYEGKGAVSDWSSGFLRHAANLYDLKYEVGSPKEFSMREGGVFFSLPVKWTGNADGRTFVELGGMALVLRLEADLYKVRHYAWAVTEFQFGDK